MYICYRFQVSHQGAWCRCCLRRFGDLRKNTPLDFWSMYLMYVVDFVDFGVPKWYRHRMTPTATAASQQTPHPAATSKHPAQGSNIPFRGNPSL